MKFSLYGRGEGVQAECMNPLFVVVDNHQMVVDMSKSARRSGILPGMAQKLAVLLCPDVKIVLGNKELTKSMQFVLRILWSHTPWIQTELKDSFYAQLPGNEPPVREIRDILLEINNGLSVEQRIRLGFAENPFLARLLVEWSSFERIPGAIYRKVGRQHLLISPKLAIQFNCEADNVMPHWWEDAPIQSLWTLPIMKREALLKLGVRRLREIRGIRDQILLAQFGREGLLWKQLLEQRPGGAVFVNYPSYEKRSVWVADIFNKPPISSANEIIRKLVEDLSNQLSHTHSGVMKVGIRWSTDLKEDDCWRACKQPTHRSSELIACIQPFMNELSGNQLKKVEIWGADIQPVLGVHSAFVLHGNRFQRNERAVHEETLDINSVSNNQSLNHVKIGMKPTFRENKVFQFSAPYDSNSLESRNSCVNSATSI